MLENTEYDAAKSVNADRRSRSLPGHLRTYFIGPRTQKGDRLAGEMALRSRVEL